MSHWYPGAAWCDRAGHGEDPHRCARFRNCPPCRGQDDSRLSPTQHRPRNQQREMVDAQDPAATLHHEPRRSHDPQCLAHQVSACCHEAVAACWNDPSRSAPMPTDTRGAYCLELQWSPDGRLQAFAVRKRWQFLCLISRHALRFVPRSAAHQTVPRHPPRTWLGQFQAGPPIPRSPSSLRAYARRPSALTTHRASCGMPLQRHSTLTQVPLLALVAAPEYAPRARRARGDSTQRDQPISLQQRSLAYQPKRR